MNRRQFLGASFYSSLLLGSGALPRFVNEAHAEFRPLTERMLVNLMLDGGPDIRHLIVPAYEAGTQTVGNKYWKNRWRAHRLPDDNEATLEQRWDDDYFKITVGGSNWNGNGLVDSGSKNSGVTFGIWKEAGWLIEMFLQGNVAICSNAVGGENRNHSHSTVIMEQGNLTAGSNELDHSGWGGRLARQAGGKPVSLTNTPRAFCFGPDGNNPAAINNIDLISVQNSRSFGLYATDNTEERIYDRRQKMASSLQQYYAALAQENLNTDVYEKFMDHESKIREFGRLIDARLDFDEPLLIRGLHSDRDSNGDDHSLNNAPDGSARRVLRSSSFGRQIRNLYDVLASNDLLDLRVASMSYGGWDTHANQRRFGNVNDINDPGSSRGIESNFKDIFGGPYSDRPNDLHGGFSALWQNLNQVDKDKIVINIAGEFGRQIRDNGDLGTDHGKGNVMFLIGEGVNGGLYGDLFPASEIAKLDDSSIRTPDIDPETDLGYIFGAACDWVEANSSTSVFKSSDRVKLETNVSFNNILS
ncbi:MAG: DUF1501 domain-containing protein [Arenicella sp.]